MNRQQPALFIGHGSPMNVISDNAYTDFLCRYGKKLETPDAIVVISAHWLTRGSYISAAETPEQIYDFWGFPPELYKIKYAMKGNPDIARKIAESTGIQPDMHRGIDHAAWAVLVHLFPNANIPVLEISLDMTLPFERHYALGKKLAALRNENILFIGSGNVVHNLGDISWDEDEPPFEWALEIDEWIKDKTESNDHDALIHILERYTASHRGIPTPDHYLAVLYHLGMQMPVECLASRH